MLVAILLLSPVLGLTWQKVWTASIADSGPSMLGYGVAAFDLDGKGNWHIVTCSATKVTIYTGAGQARSSFALHGPIRTDLSVGYRARRPVFVPFGAWDLELTAYSLSGKALWTHQDSDGVDDVCSVPMGGDNGFAISYNGDGGIELLSATGKPVWKAAGTGNAWSVASMRLGARIRILAVGADTGIAAFDLAGHRSGTIPDGDAGAVAAGDLKGSGQDEVLTLGTTVSSGMRLRAWDAGGRKLWDSDGNVGNVACHKPITVGRFSGGKAQVVVGNWDGFRTFDASGAELSTLRIAGVTGIAALPRRAGGDLLIVRRRGSLTAFHLGAETG